MPEDNCASVTLATQATWLEGLARTNEGATRTISWRAMKDILCTTDLTPASDAALKQSLSLADRMGARVTLLHVLGKAERSDESRARAQATMEGQIENSGGTGVRLLLPEGDFMDTIVQESGNGHSLLVMGTHGPHGLRQSLFGADILKLVRKSHVPSFVVQAESNVDGGIGRIVMPVAGHASIDRLLEIVCSLAQGHASEVHVFQVMRPGENPSDELLANKRKMLDRLTEEGVRCVEANIPISGFSVGFAGSTVEYAKSVGAGCIAIMAHPSEEYRYIADAEKERLLANEARIPVLCA